MRILLVANGYPPHARGGVETYTQTIAQALQARGHAVEVFCRVSALPEPEYTLQQELIDGIPVRRVVNDLTGATRYEKHYLNPRFDEPFRRHLQDFQPELVHFQHCVGLSASLLPLAKAQGLPMLVTLHDFWYFCPRATLFNSARQLCGGPQTEVDCVRCLGGVSLGRAGGLLDLPIYKWLLNRLPRRVNTAARWSLERPRPNPPAGSATLRHHRRQMRERTDTLFGLLAQADRCLVPSEFLRESYAAQGLPRALIDVLPLGIDLPRRERTARAAGAGPIVAYVGSLQYHKGADLVIQAYRQAHISGGELRIYGRGVPLDVYTDQLQAAAAGDERIRLLGAYQREALPDMLAEIDLLVVPSRWHETYSLAAREALLAGVPVIASALGALPDVIQDGVNGYLVPPGDAPALAWALEQAMLRLDELKAGARQTEPAPTLAEHVTRLEEYYRQSAARAAAPPA